MTYFYPAQTLNGIHEAWTGCQQPAPVQFTHTCPHSSSPGLLHRSSPGARAFQNCATDGADWWLPSDTFWPFHRMVHGPHLAIVISSCLLWGLYKTTNPVHAVTPSWQNHISKAWPLNTIRVESRFLHRNFGETHWVCSRDSTYINFQYLATILKRRGFKMLLHLCHVRNVITFLSCET